MVEDKIIAVVSKVLRVVFWVMFAASMYLLVIDPIVKPRFTFMISVILLSLVKICIYLLDKNNYDDGDN